MSKKKQKGNGFSIFMHEMQRDFRNQGKNVSMRDMPAFAGPKWAQLPDATKQAYQAIAKKERSGEGGFTVNDDLKPPVMSGAPRTGRMDSTGTLLSQRRDYAAEMAQRRREESALLKASFPSGRKVSLEKFYFIDFQSLCEISNKGDTQYLPCEVSIVEYSLHSGVRSHLHRFIDPGRIPMGYRYLAKMTSETTHQIPISDFDRAEKDYRKILGDMEHFLDPNWTEVMPPVFSKSESAEKVEWCLGWLADKAGVMNRLNKVYEVEALICELSGHLDEKPLGRFQAKEMLKTSVYDHDKGTRCGFHEQKETAFCSLGFCNIYSYILSEALCSKYGISLTSNHLPKFTITSTVTTMHLKTPSDKVASDVMSGSNEDVDELPGVVPPVPIGRGRGMGRGFNFTHVGKVREVGGLQTHNH